MKLLITSDIHGHEDRLEEVIKKHPDINYHLNAGDMVLNELVYQKHHIVTVKGNCDFFSNEPLLRVLDLDGLKILLTHGHKEGVKAGLDQLISKAQYHQVNMVIFGHTHQAYLKEDLQITILNPGALGDYHRSYAIYDQGQITFYQL